MDRLLQARGPFERIIHGDARGVDKMAGKWARDHGILEWDFLPEWHRVDADDGLNRNQRMILAGAPDLVVAFPGGEGTENMIEQAKAAAIEVIEVRLLRRSPADSDFPNAHVPRSGAEPTRFEARARLTSTRRRFVRAFRTEMTAPVPPAHRRGRSQLKPRAELLQGETV